VFRDLAQQRECTVEDGHLQGALSLTETRTNLNTLPRLCGLSMLLFTRTRTARRQFLLAVLLPAVE
jgi:hypothetical protein